jgi:hypothetical protein
MDFFHCSAIVFCKILEMEIGMKRLSVLFCSLFLSAQSIGSAVDHHACQCVENSLLIGRAAPGITAKAVAEENIVDRCKITLENMLFSYFTLLILLLFVLRSCTLSKRSCKNSVSGMLK